jgi:hypothetical protein
MLLEVLTGPWFTHNLARVAQLPPQLRDGDVLLGDCGCYSFAHLALRVARGVHGVCRRHQRQIVDVTPHRPHA